MLDALPAVLKRRKDFQLEIVGQPFLLPLDWLPTLGEPAVMAELVRFYDGKGYMAHLREQIARLNLTGYVIFSGKLPREQLIERYRQADIFVFPSLCLECRLPKRTLVESRS